MKILHILAFILVCSPATAFAGYCTDERITNVITSQDGATVGIYFTTNKSCANWCSVPTTWNAEAKARAYSMLLTSASTGRNLTFFWPQQATVCAPLPLYSVPDLIVFPQ